LGGERMTLMQRRRALMGGSKDEIKIQKTFFTVEQDKTSTGSGGNAYAFFNTYAGTERGFYFFDISNNPTSNGYVQFAFHDYRIGMDQKVTVRRPNSVAAQAGSNYDAFLKSGAIITRYFVPQAAFDNNSFLQKTVFDIEEEKASSTDSTKSFFNNYFNVGPGYAIFDIDNNNPAPNYAMTASVYNNRANGNATVFCRYNGYIGQHTYDTYSMYLASGSKVVRYFISETELP
jgi:hypothetical protein